MAALALAALAAVVLLVVAWRAGGAPRLLVDRGELAVLAGVALVAVLLFFPGFRYGVGKDPGAYVSHAIAIARVGSTSLDDPVLDRSRVPAVVITPRTTTAASPRSGSPTATATAWWCSSTTCGRRCWPARSSWAATPAWRT